jgi:tetratricopeptide (TPR) repeat protein
MGFRLDFRDAKGPVVNPSGNVEQQFGDRNYYIINIPKPDEISMPPSISEPPFDLTGREKELADLQAEFASGKNIIGLRGIGGVGKTALSLKLAESLKDRYPDGQIMVDMMGTTNPISPVDAMASVIRSFYRNEKIPESEADAKKRYREVLNGKHVLLLLDNAIDDKQVLSLIPPRSCALLITSRRTIVIPGLIKKDLDVMKSSEAVELVLNVCCPSDQDKLARDDPAWLEIASLCGFLPLALRAAASFLANSEDISPKQYSQDLKDERTRLERIGEQGVEMSVDASFGLSFQRLVPAVQKTFLDLSVFPADFDAQAEEQICQDAGHRNLSELLRWSLVDFKSQNRDYGRYRVHDLARLFAFARQPDESRAAIAERHASYFRDLLAAADNLYLQGAEAVQAGLALFDREGANIMAGHAWSCKNLESISQAAELCMGYPDAGAYVISLRLHPKQRISWLEEALKSARKLKNKRMEGSHLGNMGLAYANLGDARKAIEYYEQQLTITREIGDRRGEGNAMGNMGNAYAALGDARKAIEYHEQRLVIAREIGDRRGEGNAMGNMGLAYADLGDARKAIEYYEQALVIDREIGDRRGEGADLGNMGIAYKNLGDARKAIEYYEQALVIDREIGDRRGEGKALFNSSLSLYKLGKHSEAVMNAEAALEIFRHIESPAAARVEQKLAEWRK